MCESGLSLYMAIELAVSNFVVANLNKYILDNYVDITKAKNLSRALADVDFFSYSFMGIISQTLSQLSKTSPTSKIVIIQSIINSR